MANEQLSAVDLTSGEAVAEEQPKPSLLKKVKAKARRLKNRMLDENPHGRNHGIGADESDSSSSEEREEGTKMTSPNSARTKPVLPQQQTPTGGVRPQPPTGAVQPQQQNRSVATGPKAEGPTSKAASSGGSAYGCDSTTTADTQFPVDPVVLKNDGPLGMEQAVPTNYNYFNSDPSIETLPSGDGSSQRQRNVPSSFGGESAGVTAATEKLSKGTESQISKRDGSLSKSGDRDSELPRSFTSSEGTEQNNDPGLAQPRKPSSQSPRRSQPLQDPPPHALTPHNSVNFSEWAASNAPKQSTSATSRFSEEADQKSIANRVTDTAFGLMDSVASKLGYADQAVSSDSTPVSEKAVDSAGQGKDYAANVLHSAGQGLSSDEKPVLQKTTTPDHQEKTLTDSIIGLPGMLTSKLGLGGAGSPTASSPTSAPAERGSSFKNGSDVVSQKTTTPDHQEKTLTDSIIGLPGMLTSKLGLGGAGTPKASSPTSAPAEPGSSFKNGSDVPIASTPNSSASYDSSTRKDTPYPDHPSTTASHGLYDRVADIAASLFSGGADKQQPTTEGEKSSFPARKSV